MESKRNTIGDLDKVLQELGTFSIDFDDSSNPAKPTPPARIKLPRVTIPEETEPQGVDTQLTDLYNIPTDAADSSKRPIFQRTCMGENAQAQVSTSQANYYALSSGTTHNSSTNFRRKSAEEAKAMMNMPEADYYDMPIEKDDVPIRTNLPRVPIAGETKRPVDYTNSTTSNDYENMSNPAYSYVSDASEVYDTVVEEMGRRLSQRSYQEETDYVDIDSNPAEADPDDYVSMDTISLPSSNLIVGKHLSDIQHSNSLPRISISSREVALAKLKANSEPRRKTDPVISSLQDKLNFLRDTSRKMSEKANRSQVIVNFHFADNSYKTIIIEEAWLAKDVCEILIAKNRLKQKPTWQLFERLESERLERPIEDHEKMTAIYERWEVEKENKFIIRENFKKYDFFQNPLDYLPNHLLDSEEKKKTTAEARDRKKAAKEALVKELAFNTNQIFDMEGLLWIRERGKWKEAFSFIRTSGIYYSTKGKSKEAKHTRQLVDFTEVDIYNCYDDETAKKVYQAKTDFLIVFKKTNEKETSRDMVCVCTRSRRNQLSFQQCSRMAKFGTACLRNNYRNAMQKHERMKKMQPGRIPKRKKVEESVQKEVDAVMNAEWFYNNLSKPMASEIVSKDRRNGAFLIRLTDGELFLTMHNAGTIYHFVIQTMELELDVRFTIEEGTRNFNTLAQLIEFYKEDSGSLPTHLTFPAQKGFVRLPMLS